MFAPREHVFDTQYLFCPPRNPQGRTHCCPDDGLESAHWSECSSPRCHPATSHQPKSSWSPLPQQPWERKAEQLPEGTCTKPTQNSMLPTSGVKTDLGTLQHHKEKSPGWEGSLVQGKELHSRLGFDRFSITARYTADVTTRTSLYCMRIYFPGS